MTKADLSIIITACDPYLAGIYARKFEREGWEVEVLESIKEAEQKSSKIRPSIILLDDGCSADIALEVEKFRSFPTLQKTKIVVISKTGDMKKIARARSAGASDYLIFGHFVPQEAVQKMKKLLGA